MNILKKSERIEAGFMLASYLETIGFRNGIWEFNYGYKLDNINLVNKIWLDMILDFFSLGGFSSIDITDWSASDDTILLIATTESIINKPTTPLYKDEYLKVLPLLEKEKRYSGATTIESLNLLKRKQIISSNKNMGGNGAAMRTGPIGIKWHDNEEKIIEESIKASVLTHNYYIGYLGGVVSALFSAYAINNIEPKLWIDKLLKLYNNKTLHKYFPKEHDIILLDNYINYWKRYKEFKKDIKTSSNYIPNNKHLNFLMSFNPSNKIQEYVKNNELLVNKSDVIWNSLGITGIDCCIYAYDCLLNSFINGKYCWENFMINVAIHIGDNDTTGCIGGFWFGLLLGYNNIDKTKMKQLEFYDKLLYISKNVL
jgi:ADP-ribosylarginine hydrolase